MPSGCAVHTGGRQCALGPCRAHTGWPAGLRAASVQLAGEAGWHLSRRASRYSVWFGRPVHCRRVCASAVLCLLMAGGGFSDLAGRLMFWYDEGWLCSGHGVVLIDAFRAVAGCSWFSDAGRGFMPVSVLASVLSRPSLLRPRICNACCDGFSYFVVGSGRFRTVTVNMCSRLVAHRMGVGVPPVAGRVFEGLRCVRVLTAAVGLDVDALVSLPLFCDQAPCDIVLAQPFC